MDRRQFFGACAAGAMAGHAQDAKLPAAEALLRRLISDAEMNNARILLCGHVQEWITVNQWRAMQGDLDAH